MDRNCFKVFWPGPEAQSVERLIQRAIGPEFNTLSGHILLFLLLLIQERQLSAGGKTTRT